MIYRVLHRNTYDYEDPVSVSHHLVRLTPRNIPGQVCRETAITIAPSPDLTTTHDDYFGNVETFFTLGAANQLPDAGLVSPLQGGQDPDRSEQSTQPR